MPKIKKVESEGYPTRYRFECPGCGFHHDVTDEWEFDGDYENPTITPSVLVTGGKRPDGDGNWKELRCHSYVNNGKIQFLGDCNHDLAGQTVELPNID